MPELYLNTQNNFISSGPVNHHHYHYHFYGNAAPRPDTPEHSGQKKRQWWSGFTAELLKLILTWLWENLICKWLATMMLLCLVRVGMGAEDAINWANGLISLLTVIFTNLLK